VHISDVVIAGGGIIGLSLAIELRREGASVTVLDRGEPGQEASSAAAGMLVTADPDLGAPMRALAQASAAMYPAFVQELELRSQISVGFEDRGALYLASDDEEFCLDALAESELRVLEPELARHPRVFLLPEQSVEPSRLVQAALAAAKQMGIVVHHEATVCAVAMNGDHQLEVSCRRISYQTPTFVNCAGAWAKEIQGASVPTLPRKGQMLSVVPRNFRLKHVVRSHEVYLVPRKDGRVIIGATIEDVGFDKNVEPAAIQRLHQAAANLVPAIGEAKMIEAWAGLRPGSPDDLPIMGPGRIPGTYMATGHFRNGILLAPITAALMTDLILGRQPRLDLTPFAPHRFRASEALSG